MVNSCGHLGKPLFYGVVRKDWVVAHKRKKYSDKLLLHKCSTVTAEEASFFIRQGERCQMNSTQSIYSDAIKTTE